MNFKSSMLGLGILLVVAVILAYAADVVYKIGFDEGEEQTRDYYGRVVCP